MNPPSTYHTGNYSPRHCHPRKSSFNHQVYLSTFEALAFFICFWKLTFVRCFVIATFTQIFEDYSGFSDLISLKRTALTPIVFLQTSIALGCQILSHEIRGIDLWLKLYYIFQKKIHVNIVYPFKFVIRNLYTCIVKEEYFLGSVKANIHNPVCGRLG